jgi:hypothetical protein
MASESIFFFVGMMRLDYKNLVAPTMADRSLIALLAALAVTQALSTYMQKRKWWGRGISEWLHVMWSLERCWQSRLHATENPRWCGHSNACSNQGVSAAHLPF